MPTAICVKSARPAPAIASGAAAGRPCKSAGTGQHDFHADPRHRTRRHRRVSTIALEQLRLDTRHLELDRQATPEALAEIAAQRAELQAEYTALQQTFERSVSDIRRDSMAIEIQTGQVVELPLEKVVHVLRPNEMGSWPS